MKFNSADIYSQLENMDRADLDQLDFGIVRMNKSGEIKDYNQYESKLATISTEEAVGKNFFTQIAPCTNNFLVAEKYQDANASLDEELDYVFTYRIQPTKVRLRLLVRPENENQYLLVKIK